MTVQALPWAIQGQSHDAEVARAALAAIFGAPAAAFTNSVAATTAGGSHGVVGSGDLAVTQNGTPNMSVNVAAGRCVVRSGNSSSVLAGTWTGLNDATVNVAIAASDPSNPRIDLVIFQVRDTNYGEAANDARIAVVTGTPAASPTVPSLTSYPNSIVLAQVSVAAGATTILTANIADKRTRCYAVGGIGVCTTATRPTGASLYTGLVMYDLTVNGLILYTGSDWKIIYPSVDVQVFTGNGTWTKPADAAFVTVIAVGGGGGGGSGRRGAAGTIRGGGGGGGGGHRILQTINATLLGATEAVTVGASGAGGANVTADNTNGNSGADGGRSAFGGWVTALGGRGGAGGGSSAAYYAGGRDGAGNVWHEYTAGYLGWGGGGGGAGGYGAGLAYGWPGLSNTAHHGGSGGGGGGGVNAANATFAAGAGGERPQDSTNGYSGGGAAGTSGAAGTTGAAGSAATTNLPSGGSGGGGGGGGSSGLGGGGGAGGLYGGGGGGGGGATNGNTAFAGGAGAAGIVVVVTSR